MALRLIFVTIILLIIAPGCYTATSTPHPFDTRPPDFTVVYEWQEGSLPPPYHYEYTITLSPDGQGQIVLIPDYESAKAPHWTETFTVTPAALDQLYRLLIDRQLFTQRWQAQSAPPVGGSSDSLRVAAHGQQIIIPSFVITSQAAAANDVAAAVRALVPQSLWDKLNTQREQYMQAHSN